MKPVQCNENLVSSVGADGLVLWHQGISSYSAEFAPMCMSNTTPGLCGVGMG